MPDQRTEPPPRYYLENYRTLIQWVQARYADLLLPAEQDFIARFSALADAPAALLVRMITRKGQWFRADKFNYPEIGTRTHIDEALAALAQAGLIDRGQHPDLAQLFALYTRAELAPWLGQKSGTKAEWLAQASATYGEAALDWHACGFPAALYAQRIALTCMAECEILSLLFFGNLRQSLSEFVLSELGIFRYETVPLDAASRSFQRRDQVQAYVDLHRLRERFDAEDNPLECLQQLGDLPDLAWLAKRYHRFRYRLGYRLEQLSQYQDAVTCYRDNPLPEARPRLVRCLEKAGELADALTHATQVKNAPRNEQERQWVARALPRLQRAAGHTPEKPARFTPATSRLTLPNTGVRVEQQAAAFFSAEDAPVFHCENTLWTGIAGLVLWPAVFAPMPGAFFHPFQAGPKDLHDADFVAQRQALIDACLHTLAAADWALVLRQRYADKAGVQSPFVHWDDFTEAQLELALACIPAQHFALIIRRMLFDIQANRAGFPDLVQFYPQEQRYRMIEIKGPGDRLQDNQLRWLQFFHRHQMPAEVVHVEWATDAG